MADDTKKDDMPFDPAAIAEKAFLLGLGVFETTREKTGEFVDDLIEKGKMSQSEAKKVADKLTEVAEDTQASLRKTVATETERAVKASGVVTRADYERLEAQIAELKELLAAKDTPSKPADE